MNYPINLTDPSGLFSPEFLERSIKSSTLHTIKTQRKGLYKLLLNAKSGDYVTALRVDLPDLLNDATSVSSVIMDHEIICEGDDLKFGIAYYHDIDYWLQRVESQLPHLPEGWQKTSSGHYYALLDGDKLGEFVQGSGIPGYGPDNKARTYYSDFEGQDSPLPDVVAKGWSLDAQVFEFGRIKIFDKFGNGYISWVKNIGPGSPINFPVMDGYIYPASIGNERQELENFLTGWGTGFEVDLGQTPGGGGSSWSPAFPGVELRWYLRGLLNGGGASAGWGWNGAYTWGPYAGATQEWDYLDEDVPTGIVASLPDNGCNCGK